MAKVTKKTTKKKVVARRKTSVATKKRGLNLSKIFEFWFVVPQ